MTMQSGNDHNDPRLTESNLPPQKRGRGLSSERASEDRSRRSREFVVFIVPALWGQGPEVPRRLVKLPRLKGLEDSVSERRSCPMTTRYCRFFTGALIAFALLLSSKVHAGILVTSGEKISHVGDPTPENRNRENLGACKIGFKYEYGGIFWIDFWTGNGTYCIYFEDRYRPIEAAEAARLLGKDEKDLGTPFLYRWPLGWLIFGPLFLLPIVVVLIVALCAFIGGLIQRVQGARS